jgi:hypothetical protein
VKIAQKISTTFSGQEKNVVPILVYCVSDENSALQGQLCDALIF